MIISENSKPSFEEFCSLMKKATELLNEDVRRRESYYLNRTGTLLEEDVYEALCKASIGTPFEGTIILKSGASFPDIIANKFYGVEVKSTVKEQWKSIGSSINESTRIKGIERIYLTFGKLKPPVEFISKPYEECLSDIVVTHYPRYKIDMQLDGKDNKTIFQKMEICYDDFRNLENPVACVSNYYKSQLKEGESLWWAPSNDLDETFVPPKVRHWYTLENEEKEYYISCGYALFPEIFSTSSKKYKKYALWLITNGGVIISNLRDIFSSGGKKDIVVENEIFEDMPAVFAHIKNNVDLIIQIILETPEKNLLEYWNQQYIEKDRVNQWCKIVANLETKDIDFEKKYCFLKLIFKL